MIRIVERPKEHTPDLQPVWRLVKSEQHAQAHARAVPGVGVELVITVDGERRSAQMYRGGLELGMAAAEKRQSLLDRGWAEEPADKS